MTPRFKAFNWVISVIIITGTWDAYARYPSFTAEIAMMITGIIILTAMLSNSKN